MTWAGEGEVESRQILQSCIGVKCSFFFLCRENPALSYYASFLRVSFTFTKDTSLLTLLVIKCVEVFTTLRNYQIPAVCPTTELSPDAIYSEIASDSTGGTQSQKTDCPPHTHTLYYKGYN